MAEILLDRMVAAVTRWRVDDDVEAVRVALRSVGCKVWGSEKTGLTVSLSGGRCIRFAHAEQADHMRRPRAHGRRFAGYNRGLREDEDRRSAVLTIPIDDLDDF